MIDHNPPLFQRAHSEFSGMHILENQYERGLSGARNTAIEKASGEVLVFIDEDAVAAPDWLARLLPWFEQASIMGVGGAINPVWDTGRPAWFPEEFDWVVGCTYRGLPLKSAPIRNLIGCNMAFRKEVFQTVGEFQIGMGRVGTLPVGCEETELCIRARQHWPEKIFQYEPQAAVLHRVPRERATLRYFLTRCYSEGISKAKVARLVGASDGLSSEWKYSLGTLPMGMLRGFGQFIKRLQPAGLAKVVIIPAGLIVTTVGYLIGRLQSLGPTRSDLIL